MINRLYGEINFDKNPDDFYFNYLKNILLILPRACCRQRFSSGDIAHSIDRPTDVWYHFHSGTCKRSIIGDYYLLLMPAYPEYLMIV